MISDEEILKTYARYMLSIKSRLQAVAKLSLAGLDAKYIVEESIALQLRMIIEAMYMSSLCANAQKFAETWKGYRKTKDIREIKKRLKGHEWWPEPIVSARDKILVLKDQKFPEQTANETFWKCGAICHHSPMFGRGTLPSTDELNEMFDMFEAVTLGIREQLRRHRVEINLDGDHATMVECDMLFENGDGEVAVQLVHAEKQKRISQMFPIDV